MRKNMNKLVFSTHAMNLFNKFETSYEEINNLMYDLAMGNEIYDEESGKVISRRDAEKKLHEFFCEFFGVDKKSTKRERKRAYEDHAKEFFRLIEEDVDAIVDTGLKESEWFQELVEEHNQALDDELQFWTEEDVILNVAKAGRTHHDHILQRLGAGQYVSIPMARYVVAVGGDIDRYILGDLDWSKLVSSIAIAYQHQIQDLIYEHVTGAAAQLPVTEGFVGTGDLDSTTKTQFDTIIANVSIANNNSEVAIFGTKNALKKITNFYNGAVNWIAPSQKESVAHTGRLGDYEGTLLVEIPQRFARNQVGVHFYDDKKLYIFARGKDNKLVALGDSGETIIDEITERGEANANISDLMKYEVQRDFGVVTRIGQYFGQWTTTN